MKKIVILNIIILQVLICFTPSFAQISDKDWDLMLIREDYVAPSKTIQYEIALADLRDFLTENKNTSFNYFTHLQDDYVFRHVTPIKDIRDLEKGINNLIPKSANSAELDLILDFRDDAISSYRHYIIQYKPDHSYIPAGDDWAAGSPYRKWSYYYFHPGMEDEVEEVLSAWKSLYESKGISSGYRVYKGFLGIEQPVYVMTNWGVDPLDFHQNLQEVSATLGEQGAALWSKMMGMVSGVNTVEGWLLPQYSYAPGL